MARDIMALNIYSMEMNDTIDRGMGDFVDFLHSLNRIPQKIAPESVFYTEAAGRRRPEAREVEGEDRGEVGYTWTS